jgi:tight adherence protein B
VSAALALTVLVVAAPAALAAVGQEEAEIDNLYLRRIDGRDPAAVKVSFIYNGKRGDLDDLTIRENGKQVEAGPPELLAQAGVPVSIALVIDQSGSMKDSGAIDEAKSGMQRMIKELGPDDVVSIIGFSDAVKVYQEPTTDKAAAAVAIDEIEGVDKGRTAMWDAVARGATLVTANKAAQPNLLLVTDGTDDESKASFGTAVARIVDARAAVWAMGIDTEQELDRPHLVQLVAKVGGRLFDTKSAAEVGAAFDTVANSLRNQYVVSYESFAGRGSNDVEVAVGSTIKSGSYVTGSASEGATAMPTVVAQQWGPDFLQSATGRYLAFGFTGLTAGLLVFAIALLAAKESSTLDDALLQYTSGGSIDGNDDDGGMAQTAFLQRAVQVTENFAEKQGFLTKVEGKLERADLPLRAAEAIFFSAAVISILGLVTMILAGPILGLIVVVLGCVGPLATLGYLAGRRKKKFQAQLPDMLALLAGSLRAGYSLMQGVEAVGKEVGEPMGKELRRVVNEARLGRDLEESMEGVADRMDSDDFAWAVMAVRIQREVGGNLSELLMTVSETMISRERLRRDVASLTAEGKISAIVIGGLPVALGLTMYVINPEYMNPLLTTTMGQGMLGASTLAALIGFAWMKKTITIKI